ncbi:MAG: YeeE/YedE family protein [Candidatus Krumholzibacteriia bacterium]
MTPRGTRTRAIASLALLILAALTIAAILSQRWVLTAIPIGFLFGFFLQKGDLCGSAALSEVLVFRDGRKLFGIWTAVVVAMLFFALGDVLGLVTLNPKPMMWLLFIGGGLIFGAGTVLAGGCVSGCLYKGATGNLNSIVALLAMPAGIALVEYGPLKPLFQAAKARAIAGPGGAALDLPGLTGLPFWALALGFGLITLAAVYLRRHRARGAEPTRSGGDPLLRRLVIQPWKPWQAGLAIGLLALPAYLSSAASGRNYPLGVTHGVLQVDVLISDSRIDHVYQTPAAAARSRVAAPPTSTAGPTVAAAPAQPGKKVVWWLVLVVLGVLGGALTAGKLSGQARLLPKPPDQVLVAIPGGFLVGAGAALATGCIVGNVMSGWALMSVGTFLFGAAVLIGNWVTTWLYLMGGTLGGRGRGRSADAVTAAVRVTAGKDR